MSVITNNKTLRDSAESMIGILENIAGFEPSDIDGDSVELRFEDERGFDTGCDVSIVDQCQKAAETIFTLLDELESAEGSVAELNDALCKLLPGTQYMDPPDGGSVTPLEQVSRMVADYRERMEAAERRNAELEARTVTLPQRMDPEGYHIDEAYMVAAEDGDYLDRDEVIEAVRAAGFSINGEV
ncbi:ead/Ea22-like family protein [Enterobacter hormaechei]|nr:ead/Ea22-like family protein [Enterobacter hormaechei]HCM55706.1 hypothetical protein [Citrobacter freundii]